jgi:hypothetical protein
MPTGGREIARVHRGICSSVGWRDWTREFWAVFEDNYFVVFISERMTVAGRGSQSPEGLRRCA